MKALLVSFPIVMLLLVLVSIGISVYGLYLAFTASIILGIIALIVEPSPLLIGLVMIAFDKNLPEIIMNYLNS